MITYVIKSSGGDYASVDAAVAALSDPIDDVTLSIEEAYAACGLCTVNYSNANSKKLYITVAPGYRFYEQSEWASGDMEGAINAGARCTGNVVSQMATDVEVTYLGFTRDGNWINKIGDGNLIVGYCAGENNGGTQEETLFYGGGTTGNLTVHHTIVIGFCQRAFWGQFTTVYCLNCFCIGNSTNAYYYGGTVATNCIGIITSGTGLAFQYGTGDYNMSSDTSAPGTTTWKSVTAADLFENPVLGSSCDLHWLASADGDYEGDTGTGTKDIEENDRTDWDIGPFEYVSDSILPLVAGIGMENISDIRG